MLRVFATDDEGIVVRTHRMLQVNPFGADHDSRGCVIRRGPFKRYRRAFPNPFVSTRFSIPGINYYIDSPDTRERIQWIHENTKGCWTVLSYTMKAARRIGGDGDVWWFAFGFEDQGDAARYRMFWE